jgi:PAS domain S-box-containing protein
VTEDGERPRRSQSRSLVQPALRWVLMVATAAMLAPPGLRGGFGPVETALLLAWFASNLVLALFSRRARVSPLLDYAIVIADTFLLSAALFQAGLDGGRLPLVFFLVMLLAALGPELRRLVAGATLVAFLYVYLLANAPGDGETWGLLTRVPFLFAVALYFGSIARAVRAHHEEIGRTLRRMDELQAFLEVTAATNSSLDLQRVLYVVTERVARLVDAMRCSVLEVDEASGRCRVLASSDDPAITDLHLDLRKYPEVRKAIETRQVVVIQDVSREELMHEVRETVQRIGLESILVLPLMHGNDLLGMLFLRAARDGRRFTPQEIAACQVVANASANAMRNALLHEQVRQEAGSRREAAGKLQNILDQFPDLIWATDGGGRLTEFSRGGEQLLGIRRDQALGRRWDEFFAEPEGRARLARLHREGVPIQNLETLVRREDGTTRDVFIAATPQRDAAGAVRSTVGILKDISELKAVRGHLMQAEKLTALGEVVSGVAHELNNPLAGVLGYAQLLTRGAVDSKQRRLVERILDSALRCQTIVHSLLSFARRHPSEKRVLGLNGIIEKTLALKEYDLRARHVQVVRDLEPDLPKTLLDFNQIQQLLLNLINNAEYAIAAHRGGGSLMLMTRAVGGSLQLRVQDDGPGIPRKNLPRIFDPFFTTKPVGEGTGLGLSIAYGIVRDHGGRIWAEGEPGRGTTMVVELPVRGEASAGADREAPGVSEEPRRLRRPLRLLVVDDEPVILDLLVDALSGDRHEVDTAAGGAEALRKLERSTYDLVLLDLKMPDVDGRQVFERIEKRWPELKGRVVFFSGDRVHPETRAFVESTGRPCIDKPFSLEVLTSALAEAEAQATAGPSSAATDAA